MKRKGGHEASEAALIVGERVPRRRAVHHSKRRKVAVTNGKDGHDEENLKKYRRKNILLLCHHFIIIVFSQKINCIMIYKNHSNNEVFSHTLQRKIKEKNVRSNR